MIYKLLALLVLAVHLGFILFVVFGALPSLKWKWWPAVHLPAAVWGVYVEVAGKICPLTPLEQRLLIQAGEAGYRGGFIEHYLLGAIYPDGLTRGIQFGLAAAVVVVNLAIYLVVYSRWTASRE